MPCPIPTNRNRFSENLCEYEKALTYKNQYYGIGKNERLQGLSSCFSSDKQLPLQQQYPIPYHIITPLARTNHTSDSGRNIHRIRLLQHHQKISLISQVQKDPYYGNAAQALGRTPMNTSANTGHKTVSVEEEHWSKIGIGSPTITSFTR